ncbi:TetR/AcrR family transcriptional regulator [Streptomyces sp. NPDC090106]|uniref:TetR/AcrR family transcriptional regulator n=1 Tax=Streptomyces sp. NPDC090106 TaxID=3365946 RepID=UPI00381E6377
MGVQRAARRRRLAPDARRAEILAAARRLFGARSYGAVSLADIAAEAGAARALINHYFGSKRQLYLTVVRQVMVVPDSVSQRLPATGARERLSICVDRWLDVVGNNREMWLSAIDLQAVSRDPDIDQIMFEADEAAIDCVLEAAMMGDVTEGRTQLRALVRAHSGMLKAASREWLVRGTLERGDLHVMLTSTALHLVEAVFPALHPAHRTNGPEEP